MLHNKMAELDEGELKFVELKNAKSGAGRKAFFLVYAKVRTKRGPASEASRVGTQRKRVFKKNIKNFAVKRAVTAKIVSAGSIKWPRCAAVGRERLFEGAALSVGYPKADGDDRSLLAGRGRCLRLP